MSFSAHTLPLNDTAKITASTPQEVQESLSHIQDNAVIFIDVDDTLITPQSALFRISSPYRFLIDEIKKESEKIENFDLVLSHWRLQRKSRLVSEEWPRVINTLKAHFPVYALTKMNSRSIGAISSMEKWRYEELKGKGLSFTSCYNGFSENTLIADPSELFPATFYRGIFITGSYNKSDVVRAFLKTHHPSQMILIDDREDYLQDFMAECHRQYIPALGILFKGADLIPGQPNPKVAEFQKQYLLKYAQWLEDEEAENLLYSKNLSETNPEIL